MRLQPSASYSFTMRLRLPQQGNTFAAVAQAIAESTGMLGAIDLVRVERDAVDPRPHRRLRRRRATPRTVVKAVQGGRRRQRRQRLRPHVPVHMGGKIRSSRRCRSGPARPVDGLHAGRRPRDPRATTTRTRRSPSRSRPTPWRSSATAPPSSGSATSAPPPRCRSWRARRRSSRSSPTSTAGRCASTPRTRRDRQLRRAGRARVRRHQPRGHRAPRCFEIEGRLRATRHPGLSRRPARHRDRRARGAAERAEIVGKASRTSTSWSSAPARPASPARRSCSRRASAT